MPGRQTARIGNKLFPFLSFLLFLFFPGNQSSVIQEGKGSENTTSSTDQLDAAFVAVLPKTGSGQAHLSQVQKNRQMIDEQISWFGKAKGQLKKSWKARKSDQSKENTVRREAQERPWLSHDPWGQQPRARFTRVKVVNRNNNTGLCSFFAFAFLKKYWKVCFQSNC